MKFPILIMLLVCIAMPIGSAWRIRRLDERTRAGWLLKLADALVLVALVLLLGRWDIAGYYTRLALIVLVAAVTIASWHRHGKRPWRALQGPPLHRSHAATLVSLALLGAALVYASAGILPRHDARALSFPLAGGHFIVAQGGGNLLLNHHASHRAQRYAVDITALGAAGFRAGGILPADPRRYAVYGATVVSPCDGEIVSTQAGLPDLEPPHADRDHAAGNHVVIACDGMRVELAHLQHGSLLVAAGARVTTGQPIAKVGNSGNTTEPHLHVHAVHAESGAAIALSFEGRTPVRNRVFRRE